MEEARAVRPEELGQTLALVNRVFRTGVDQDMSTDYPLVFAPGNLDNLRVVSEGGRILSHAAMARRELREHGCALPISMICAVATDPEHRRRGAASRIMEDATEAMAARGDAFGLLWTGPARDFYRRLGWEVVGSNGWAYLVEPQLAGRFEQPLPVRAFQAESDLERIIEIHEAQPRQLTRTPAEYRTLLGLPKSEVWVAEEKGGWKATWWLPGLTTSRGWWSGAEPHGPCPRCWPGCCPSPPANACRCSCPSPTIP